RYWGHHVLLLQLAPLMDSAEVRSTGQPGVPGQWYLSGLAPLASEPGHLGGRHHCCSILCPVYQLCKCIAIAEFLGFSDDLWPSPRGIARIVSDLQCYVLAAKQRRLDLRASDACVYLDFIETGAPFAGTAESRSEHAVGNNQNKCDERNHSK